MLYNIYIIGEEYIKEHSSVMNNVDPKMLSHHIFEAQVVYLRVILGDNLFDEMFSQLQIYKDAGGKQAPSGITYYVEERILDLIDKCEPVVLYYTLMNAVYSLSSKITNKGVVEQSSDFSTNTTMEYLMSMKKDWTNKAEVYANLLVEFIKDNIEDYPEFNDCDNCDDCGDSDVFTCPVYLGNEL